MYCEKCGKKLNKNDKFCEECGLKVIEEGKEGLKNESENENRKLGRFISKFTLVFVGLILLAFFIFWIYKFGIFTPEKGTSIASSSALWGQFVVSLLAVVVFCAILIVLDIRKKATPVYKLFSFWLIICVVVAALGLYTYHAISYGETHTYQEGEEFRYGPYTFAINGEFSDIEYLPSDCSWHTPTGRINWCESGNERRKTESENKKYLALKVKVKNNSFYEQPITTNWFQVFGESGEAYKLTQADFETSNVPSESTREGALYKINVDKSEKEFNIKIALPNKAEQIVKIQAR
ncbi:MAG: hypothetical protein M1324_01210 [Patescibacteria group bacterium]|nr:hypothetical protein [Patescibacteria group bacterium]